MNPAFLRSACPINAALELFGDKWSLLILRDIIYFGKNSFSDFLASEEGIARNILVARLRQLLAAGIISKQPDDLDSRKQHYAMTETGLDLIPVLLALADWGIAQVPGDGSTAAWFAAVASNREAIAARIRATVLNGGSIFRDGSNGYPALVRQLGDGQTGRISAADPGL